MFLGNSLGGLVAGASGAFWGTSGGFSCVSCGKQAKQWFSAIVAAALTRSEFSAGPNLFSPFTQSVKAAMVLFVQQQPRFKAKAAS
jgi:hypothetical protein